MRYVRDLFRGWGAETAFGFYGSSIGAGLLVGAGGFLLVSWLAS